MFTPPASSTASRAPTVALGGGGSGSPEASPQTKEKLEADLQVTEADWFMV